jgi:peptide/nickel transport system substrate-binding protein
MPSLEMTRSTATHTSSSAWALALSLFLSGAACKSAAPDRVRVGTDVDAGSLDPRLMRDTTSYRVVDLLYDGLVRLDSHLTPRPALATRWENPAPNRWVFHLREARFHDGRELTAEDVVETFETVLDPAFGAPLRSLYEPIEQVAAKDDRTVEILLREPFAPLLSYLDLGIVPRGPRSSDGLGTHPIGTGPYRLRRWDRGSKMVLEANPDYWAGAPAIGEIEMVVVADNTARAQAFEAGDLDVIQSPLSPQDIRRLASDARFRSLTASGIAFTYFNFNTAKFPFDNRRARRAVAMLIDQSTILDEIYGGTDEKAGSILLPSSWAFSEEVAQPTYDPERADALLDELGFRERNGDGFRERDGRKLAFELATHGEDVNRVQTLELLQNELRSHGIDAELRITDWASFSVRRDASDYDLILLGWTQLVDPDKAMYDQFHSEGGLNWGGYRNARVDELLEEGRRETDRERRASIYRQIAAIVASDIPYYVLSYQSYHLFHSPRIAGFEADPRGMLRSLATSTLRSSN